MTSTIDHIIDGSQGEGGGQILRTSLSMAMCLGKSVRIENIRAGRAKPGLMRSHLAAARAAAQVSCAELSGAQMGSTRLEFRPQAGAINGGTYRFAIGTAGSTTLLLQTLLPALVRAKEESLIMLAGGTHNGMAPSVDFMEQSFFPAIARMGIEVKSELRTHGFFPSGGGDWHVVVKPARRSMPFELIERGTLRSREVVAKVARLSASIAEREVSTVVRRLGLRQNEMTTCTVDSPGPGNIVSARFKFDEFAAVFEERGEKRVSAELVGKRLSNKVRRYFQHDEPVEEYLADQLMVPMVLGAGGVFRTRDLSKHSLTNMAVIEQLLGAKCFELIPDSSDKGGVSIRVEGLASTQV